MSNTTNVENVALGQTSVQENAVYETANNEGGVAASLGLNTQLFIFQLINFTIVAIILWFLILKPLIKKMDERKKVIDESLDKAKEIETKLQMSEVVYQEKIDEAKSQANKIMEKAQERANEMVEEMKGTAKEEIEHLIKQAKSKIEAEKNAMIEGVKNNAADLIASALEKVLGQNLTENKDKKIIEKYLSEINK